MIDGADVSLLQVAPIDVLAMFLVLYILSSYIWERGGSPE